MCRQKVDLESKESRIVMSVCRAVCWILNRFDDGDGEGEGGEGEGGSQLGSKATIYL